RTDLITDANTIGPRGSTHHTADPREPPSCPSSVASGDWAGLIRGTLRGSHGCTIRNVEQMTRGKMSAFRRLQLRCVARTAIEHIGAARMKAAALRGIDGARDVALKDDAAAGGSRYRDWHGRQQGFGVGMLRRSENPSTRRCLNDLAEVHDGD